jgi:hypothetical protein
MAKGWLDNYNDSKVNLPEGYVGEGIFNGPIFENPAIKGQFQTGGKLKFLQPTSDKLPEGYVIPYDTPSSERAMSIGGEDGEPAYLIPSFKYGRSLDDPMGEFRKTGEHLGGPFKTWQEADEWENETRHPAVERKETIMFPQEKFQVGGVMPGAVGHMYARTGSPSKGPRRNQTDVTDASAQNGKEMQYYQQGLDWKPKTISKNGAWLDNYEEAQTGKSVKFDPKKFAEDKKRNTPLQKSIDKESISEDKRRWFDTKEYKDQVKANKAAEDKAILQDRKDRTNKSVAAQKKSFTKDNWRQQLADETQATGDKFRIFPEDPDSFIDEWMNPGVMIGNMASDLGSAPLRAQQEDSYMPYVTSIGVPLLTGGLEGIGAKTTGQFVSNLVNPLNIVPGYNSAKKAVGKALGTEEGLLSNVYKLNPYAERLNDANKSYRVAGLDALEDFQNTGILRSVQQGVPEGASLTERAMSRPTGFPSFQKGYADMRYAPEEGAVVFETGLPTFKRGEINPVTGFPIKGRHYAHRVINPETGATMGQIPASDIRAFGDKPHWLQGYKEIPKQEDGGIIKDDRGQWDHPGEITEINSNDITMEGVPYDVLGISDTGDTKLMKPGKNYKFKGKKVTEYPMAKNGVNQQDQKTLQQLDQLTNFTNYNKPQPGGWLNKYKS